MILHIKDQGPLKGRQQGLERIHRLVKMHTKLENRDQNANVLVYGENIAVIHLINIFMVNIFLLNFNQKPLLITLRNHHYRVRDPQMPHGQQVFFVSV